MNVTDYAPVNERYISYNELKDVFNEILNNMDVVNQDSPDMYNAHNVLVADILDEIRNKINIRTKQSIDEQFTKIHTFFLDR